MRDALLLAVLASACSAPPVFSGADRRQNTVSGRVEGAVVASTTSRGNVVVLLYDAARPPPPTGSGRPVAFSVVTGVELFGTASDGDLGPFTAPYSFSLVPPGAYTIRAFLDANRDFVPWYGVTAEVNGGDVGGAALESPSQQVRAIVVPKEDDGDVLAALDVPVTLGDAARVPFDRPVFSATVPVLTLQGPRVNAELVATPIVAGPVQQRQPIFLVRYVDNDNDGRPDDANRDGVPDVWPRVLVRKLAESPSGLIDENDLDRNGQLDDAGVDYEHLNPTSGAVVPPDGQPDAVVLAAVIDVSDVASQLMDAATGRVKTTPTPLVRLRLVVNARALDISNPAAPQVLRQVPAGRYAVTLVQQTGQTWRVPNELAPGTAEALGLPAVASQAFVIVVP